MARSRFLPDPARLDGLLAAVASPSAAEPAPPARLRFPRGAAPAPIAEVGTGEAAPALGGETLEERLDAFLGWLSASTGAVASFIADEEGLALANRHAPESYLVATAALGIAERAMKQYVPRPADAGTVFDLDGDNVLHVLWVQTAAGRLALGLVLGAALPRAIADKARRTLQISMEGKGNAR